MKPGALVRTLLDIPMSNCTEYLGNMEYNKIRERNLLPVIVGRGVIEYIDLQFLWKVPPYLTSPSALEYYIPT